MLHLMERETTTVSGRSNPRNRGRKDSGDETTRFLSDSSDKTSQNPTSNIDHCESPGIFVLNDHWQISRHWKLKTLDIHIVCCLSF